MSETDWNKVAQVVLAKCSSKDPYFPKPSAALAMGWGEEFAKWNLTPEDLIAGVSKAYGDHVSGFRPLPRDIIDAARALRNERAMKEPEEISDQRFRELERKVAHDAAELVRLESPPVPRPTGEYIRRGDDTNPLNVPCPYCKATIGRPCVNSATGHALRESPAHPSRVELFEQQYGQPV
jgi:hypothetical protein